MDWKNCTLTKRYYAWIDSIVLPWLQKKGFTQNKITVSRLIFSLLVPLGFYAHPFWGLLLLVLSGMADSLDGYLLPEGTEKTKAAALWDSIIDRISDVFYLMGFWVLFWQQGKWIVQASVAIFVAILLCFLINYIKARAESLEAEYDAGIMDRTTRVVYQLGWAFLLFILPGAREGLLWIGLVMFIALCLLTVVEGAAQVFNKLKQ
ncbi:CDP-alcohol phosphatidyltransferase family protein [Desulfovulcanus sp.]